jgi:beta-lactamase regulating signal transducer with metallopeptidase domain
MNELLTYLLKTAIIQCVLLLCYRLLMQGDTFHKMIRFYFMAGLMFSYIAPLIRFDFRILPPPIQSSIPQLHQFVQQEISAVSEIPAVLEIPAVSETYISPQTVVQWWQSYSFTDILTGLFVAGMLIMLIWMFVQYLSLACLHVCRKHKYPAYSILDVDMPIKPFSFMKRIYINPALHNASELDEIVKHELVHIRQYHSVDIIVAAINRSIFWWNPFVRILNGDIRNNLEYIVDNEMLQNGINRKHYQYHLLNVNQLTCQNNVVNYFNFSNIKKRIKMMNKEKTQPVYKIKWLLLPLVATVILLSFNVERAIATNVDFTVNSEIIELESTMEPIVEDDSLVNKVTDTSVKKLSGKVVGFTKTANDSIVIFGISDDCLIMIDGKESNKAGLAKLKQDEIHSVKVLKKDYAINKYGRKGENGMVIIETNDNVSKSKNRSDTAVFATLNQLAVNRLKDENTPLVIIDGKESNEAEFSKLNSSEVYSLSIMKDNVAIELYGEKGKNGVIIVETNGNAKASNPNKTSDTVTVKSVKLSELEVSGDGAVIDEELISSAFSIIIDGEELSVTELSKLKPGSIFSVNVTGVNGDNDKKIYIKTKNNGKILKSEQSDDVVVAVGRAASSASASFTSSASSGSSASSWSSAPAAPAAPFALTTLFAPDTVLMINQHSAVKGWKERNHAPLIIIDGKESNETEFSKLNSNEIQSISTFKGNVAIKKYGEKGKNGVIVIETNTGGDL